LGCGQHVSRDRHPGWRGVIAADPGLWGGTASRLSNRCNSKTNRKLANRLPPSIARFEVALFDSREATVAHSLGRQPKDRKKGKPLAAKRRQPSLPYRTAGAASRLRHSFLRVPWAHAQGYMLSPLRGCKCATSKIARRVRVKRPLALRSVTIKIDIENNSERGRACKRTNSFTVPSSRNPSGCSYWPDCRQWASARCGRWS
jgi:hypothetical protein